MATRTPFTRETNPLASDGPDPIDKHVHPDHPMWPKAIASLYSGHTSKALREDSRYFLDSHHNPTKQKYLDRLAERLDASPYLTLSKVPEAELAEMTAY